jgi:hypothetical protein
MTLPDLIAYYLAINYPTVLETFIQAAGIPQPDLNNPPQPDLRSVVEDYASNRAAQDIGAMSIEQKLYDGTWEGWSRNEIVKLDLPKETALRKVIRTIEGVSAANLLTVGVYDMPKRQFHLPTATQVVFHIPLTSVTRPHILAPSSHPRLTRQ